MGALSLSEVGDLVKQSAMLIDCDFRWNLCTLFLPIESLLTESLWRRFDPRKTLPVIWETEGENVNNL